MVRTGELPRDTAPARIRPVPDAPTRIDAFREAITWTAASGFTMGALVRPFLVGLPDPYGLLVWALYLLLGAMSAAVVAGVVVNLILLPVLCRLVSKRRLPDAAYRAAGAFSGLVAFACAISGFLPTA